MSSQRTIIEKSTTALILLAKHAVDENTRRRATNELERRGL